MVLQMERKSEKRELWNSRLERLERVGSERDDRGRMARVNLETERLGGPAKSTCP